MTRNRINIDVDDHLNGWLDTCAKTLGYSKTETARAILEFTRLNHLGDPFHLDNIIKEHRRSANRARGQHRNGRRQAQPESSQ